MHLMPCQCMHFARNHWGKRGQTSSNTVTPCVPSAKQFARLHRTSKTPCLSHIGVLWDRHHKKCSEWTRTEEYRYPQLPPAQFKSSRSTHGGDPSGRPSVRWPPQVVSRRTTSSGPPTNQVSPGEGIGSNMKTTPIALQDDDRHAQPERFAITPTTSQGTPMGVGPRYLGIQSDITRVVHSFTAFVAEHGQGTIQRSSE